MTKFICKIFSFVIVLMLCFQNQLKSYVCGYSQLISPNGKQRIDLIYDFHIPCKNTNRNRLWINSCHDNEKSVYNCLKKLDKCSNCKIDLIWESHNNCKSKPGLFISHAKMLKNELNNQINLVHSDGERRKFEQIMLCKEKKSEVNSSNNTCYSCGYADCAHQINFLTKPFKAILGCVEEISTSIYNTISNNLSILSAKRYRNRFRRNRKKLRQILPYSGQVNLDFLLNNESFHEIADIEMLGNILASNKQRIMIYAGCFHCKAIKEELKKLGYKCKISSVQNFDKAFPKQMRPQKIFAYLA